VVTPAANRAADFVNRLRERGVTVSVQRDRVVLSPRSAYKHLSPEERTVLRLHRADIINLIRSAGPFVQPSMATATLAPEAARPAASVLRSEPLPVVYALGRRIREHEVREALANYGDETLADYDAGRISKADAYELTRYALCELDQRQCSRRRTS
jgi:hypothetical protein